MSSTLLRLPIALTAALLTGCPGEPTITPIDSGIDPPDLLNANPEAKLRISHFLSGIAPFDVCVKATGDADYRGPLIREQTQRNGGVFFGSVSAYLTLPAANYSVRVVGGMATSCATPLFQGSETNLPAISAGRRYTVLAAGDAERAGKLFLSLKLALIEDDLTTQGGQARLRFINASPDVTSADLGSGEGAAYQQLFKDATYGTFGPTALESKPYLTTGPQTSATFTVRSSVMGSDLLLLRNKISVAAGSVATAFLVGLRPSAGTTVNPLKLVLCDDTAPAMSGLAACAEVVP
jgi:hypothetical protein